MTPRLRANVAFGIVVLGCYLTLVHAASFAKEGASALAAIWTAIGLVDALLACWILTRHPVAYLRGLLSARPASTTELLLALAAGLALSATAFFHFDWLLTRYRGAIIGRSGAVEDIRTWMALAGLASVYLMGFARSDHRASLRDAVAASARDLGFVTLALVPLTNYFVRNHDALSRVGKVEYFAFFLAWPVAAIILLKPLGRVLGASMPVGPVIASIAFVHYSMPMVTTMRRTPIESLFALQLGLVLTLAAAIWGLHRLNARALRTGVFGFTGLSLATFLAGALLSQPQSVAADPTSDVRAADSIRPAGLRRSGALSEALRRPLQVSPDVYFLVYDSYAAPSLFERYGIDNSASDAFLQQAGFTIYPDAYSVFAATAGSMSRTMDMRDVPRSAAGGPNAVMRFFNHHGYHTSLVLGAYLSPSRRAARDVYPVGHRRRADSALFRGVAGGEFKAEIVLQDSPYEEWLDVKRRALTPPSSSPLMLYAHSRYPGHSQNSGRCTSDETAEYSKRLRIANTEMRGDIEAILATQRESIIIVASDHGPYLTGDCLEMTRTRQKDLTALHLADRFGVKLAIRWPGATPPAVSSSVVTLQDVFFAVIAHLQGSDDVLAHRLPTATVGVLSSTHGIPSNAIADGIVQVGADRGRPLFAR